MEETERDRLDLLVALWPLNSLLDSLAYSSLVSPLLV